MEKYIGYIKNENFWEGGEKDINRNFTNVFGIVDNEIGYCKKENKFILSEEIVCIPEKRLSDDKIIGGFYIAITISSQNHDKLILPIIEASIGGCLSRRVTMLMLGNQILADITLSKLHKTLEACEYKIETRNRLLYPVRWLLYDMTSVDEKIIKHNNSKNKYLISNLYELKDIKKKQNDKENELFLPRYFEKYEEDINNLKSENPDIKVYYEDTDLEEWIFMFNYYNA